MATGVHEATATGAHESMARMNRDVQEQQH
jgi:hypothetical protein